jgi:Domain of unknown function (DUF4112)
MPNGYIRGEILAPVSRGIEAVPPAEATVASNEDLNVIATWLDDRFVIPGTRIRFGLDAIIGWIPGIGDALAAFASIFIVFSAWKRGVARVTLMRMVLNLAIEDTLGAIPVVGDMAHIAWKANRRNYNLLVRDQQQQRRHTWHDWVFVICVSLILVIMFLAPFALLFYFLRSHPGGFHIFTRTR